MTDAPIFYGNIPLTCLLRALWDNTRAIGNGVWVDRIHGGSSPTHDVIIHEVGDLESGRVVHVDYLHGRPIKITFDTATRQLYGAHLYDRDAPGGVGTAQRTVDQLARHFGSTSV